MEYYKRRMMKAEEGLMEEQSNEEAPHFTLLPNIETPKGNIQIGKP